jgi:hypothetical protein
MQHGKFCQLISLPLLVLALFASPLQAADHAGGAGAVAEAITMPAPGEKVMFGNDRYLIYSFDKKPNKLGTVILKVQASERGEKDTSLTIIVDAGMPSMRGMHDVQDTCRLSKKGDYMVPVAITMPGDWEITLTVMKAGELLFRGRHRFDV